MSGGGFRAVFRLELSRQLRRPLFWVLVITCALTAWGLSNGAVHIQSGDSEVGGKKAWLTSAFAVAQVLPVLTLIYYGFFVSIAAGMGIIQDDELKVGALLHSTPLTPRAYIWGRYLAVTGVYLLALALHVGVTIFVNHLLPNGDAADIRGPFALSSYLVPTLVFCVPSILFVSGAAFALGERTRQPILVFVLPVVLLLVCGFWLWDWAPTWLDPRVDRILMLLDPGGFRWLDQTFLKVDRGVDFYNTQPIPFDAGFLISRLAFSSLGLLLVAGAERHFKATLRGEKAVGWRRGKAGGSEAGWSETGASSAHGDAAQPGVGSFPSLSGQAAVSAAPPASVSIGKRAGFLGAVPAPVPADVPAGAPAGTPASIPGADRPGASLAPGPLGGEGPGSIPGFLRGTALIARAELRGLLSHAGLYIYLPLVVIQVVSSASLAVGPFQTHLLPTAGNLAAQLYAPLCLLSCLLLAFYTAEAFEREWSSGLAPIFHAMPVSTASILCGKALASFSLALVLLAAEGVAVLLVMATEPVRIDLRPFLEVWGLLLIPTWAVWCAFIVAARAVTGSRYGAWGAALGAILLTFYLRLTDHLTWVGNWALTSTILPTDVAPFELDRTAFLLNRVAALGLTAFLMALAWRTYPRREADALRRLERRSPRGLARAAGRLLPWALVPAAALALLEVRVGQGFQGEEARKRLRDYRTKNVLTWKYAELPAIAGVDLDVDLDPDRHRVHTKGTFDLVNRHAAPLARIPLTGSHTWEHVKWTLDGQEYTPDDRAKLFVFTPKKPLATGEHVRIGFELENEVPRGITRNGRGTQEFILPSSVVLTGFRPTFTPIVGYDDEVEERSIEKDRRLEPFFYPDDFFEGTTVTAYGSQTPFMASIRVTGPAGMDYHSVGVRESDTVREGRRTVVWKTDAPVSLYNIVGGRWSLHQGQGTSVYYFPEHDYNIPEMGRALDAARQYYSSWFRPYPWRELKVSEFPTLAQYAEGFPTNISFSEGIGFLTKNSARASSTFLVTAHEAAHQWWGNMLIPGRGPGGDLLSEGMSHFSAILLMEQVKGLEARIELCKRLEEHYGTERMADSERPLVKVDDAREGDDTVKYDKGGWTFWMLQQLMGREANLRGLQAFLANHVDNPDHPVLEDFVREMRPFAPDPAAFDAFVAQWFFQVVVPEYRFSDVRLEAGATAAEGQGTAADGQGASGQGKAGEGTGASGQGADGQGASGQGKAGEGTGARGEEVWTVTATVSNVGTGRMPVEVAAVSGKRFLEQTEEEAARGPAGVDPAYREARATVTLGAGEEQTVILKCPFKPERLVIDPDAKVLQLRRALAVARF